jgi:hypothetical protein
MPSEELGASAYRKYDMEAWMPGRGKWGEVSLISFSTSYRTRRELTWRPSHRSPRLLIAQIINHVVCTFVINQALQLLRLLQHFRRKNTTLYHLPIH